MTGACISGSTLYALGNTYQGHPNFTIHKYNPSTGTQTGQHMTPAAFPGLTQTAYDIAMSPEGVWIARDESDSPVLRYATNGVLTGYIDGSVIPAAAGLAIDGDGYMWASDPVNDLIYKIDLTVSTEEISVDITGPVSLRVAPNPFRSFAIVSASGFLPEASFEVFDLAGRTVAQGTVQNGMCAISGHGLPPGAYIVRVSDENGSTAALISRTAE